MNAFSTGFDMNDWQLIESRRPYELVKFVIQLLGAALDEEALRTDLAPRHLVIHPGICTTQISAALTNSITKPLQHLTNQLVCLFLVEPYNPK